MSWRKRLRLQTLVEIAKKEIDSGKEFGEVSRKLDKEMQVRWRLVKTTRMQYLDSVKKVLDGKFFIVN